MRRKSFDSMECGIARALERIGDPWSFLILREALFGTQGFEDLRRRLDINRATLTTRLGQLVDAGLLRREYDSTDARRISYCPTDCAKDLLPVFTALSQWGNKWVFGPDAYPSTVADAKHRLPVREIKVLSADGRELSLRTATMMAGPSASTELAEALDGVHRRQQRQQGEL